MHCLFFATIFIIDQVVKFGFASLGWGATGSFMNLELAYNYGVAFSMLEFLAGYLKYIQLSIVVLGTIYLIKIEMFFINTIFLLHFYTLVVYQIF